MTTIYNIKSFTGGISDFADKGMAGSGKFVSGCNIRDKSDGLKCNQALAQEGSGVIEDLVLWFVATPDNDIYGFGDTGKIYKRTNSTGVWTKVHTDSNGKIKGAALGYKFISAGVFHTYLYWATDTRLNRKLIPGESNWSDVNSGDGGFPKTNLSSSDWHMIKQINEYVLVANDNKMAGVAVDDDSYSNEINTGTLPPSVSITAITARENDLVAACSSKDLSEQGCLYAVDMINVDWVSRANMSFKKVDAAIDGEQFLMVAEGKLWYSNMYNRIPVLDIPGNGSVIPGGVALKDNLCLFAVGNAVRKSGDSDVACNGIYAYGRVRNASSPVFNLEYPIICDSMGAIISANDKIFVSYKLDDDYIVATLDANNKQVGEYESLELAAPYTQFPNRSHVESIVLKTKPMPENTKIQVYYRLNLTGDWTQAQFLSTMDNQSSDKDFTSGEDVIIVTRGKNAVFNRVLKLPQSHKTTNWCAA